MTLLQMRQLVWQWTDDPNGGYFDSTFVDGALNRGCRETQKKLIMAGDLYYVKMPPVETQTVANQASYVLPDDFLVLNRLVYVISGSGTNEEINSLGFITLNQQDLIGTSTTGTPVAFNIQKNRLTLYPIPNQVRTLRMWYSYLIADMVADSDTPDVPEDYQEYACILAAMECFIKDDRPATNILTKKSYYEELFKQMAQQRQAQGPRMVVTTENEGNYMPF